MIDLLVSFTLLIAVLSVATPLVVRHGRLLESQRHYRVALDELSIQMERLTALPADKLARAVQEVAPSSYAAECLPEAELKGEIHSEEYGRRVVLTLSWSEPGRRDAPVMLVGWVFPRANVPATATGGSQP
jgi:hypothetical protein